MTNKIIEEIFLMNQHWIKYDNIHKIATEYLLDYPYFEKY